MCKYKTLSLSLLIVAAVVSLCASAAFAAEVQPKYTSNGKDIKTVTKIQVKAGGFYVDLKRGEDTIYCSASTKNAVVGGEGQSKIILDFTGCQAIEREECTIAVPIEMRLADQLVYKEGNQANEILDIYYSEGGKFADGLWATIKISGVGCGLSGLYELRGSMVDRITPNKAKGTNMLVVLTGIGTTITGKYFNHQTKMTESAGTLDIGSVEGALEGGIGEALGEGLEIGTL
jgi:hypothetical protein